MRLLFSLLAVAVIAIGLYGYVNGVRNTGVDFETRLTAQYLDNQNNLSSYIAGFYEQLGVANLKSEKLDQILSDAVKGRYEQAGGFGKGGGFFNAIAEAYPDLAGLNVYDKIVDYVAAGRKSYESIQSKLLDMLRSYDSWRQQGILRSIIVESFLGMPSSRLVARVGKDSWSGDDALKKMYEIVLVSDAKKAYETGTMEPLSVDKK
jgi:hypothetical protein